MTQPTTGKPVIAHLAGPSATIQNTPPLVTSNKARAKYGLQKRQNGDGSDPRFDALRPQRLAAPVTVYVEQFSAHPLESDAAALYGPPDGYLDAEGNFRKERCSDEDKAVYEVELHPEDGLYPLPYMARQADGAAWEDDLAYPGAPESNARQPFFPDGARSFEEIDRLQLGSYGTANLISSKATIVFHRVLPPAGYRQAGEQRGTDFFPYKPRHLIALAPRPALARAVNRVQAILTEGRYDGAIWTEGSPVIEETLYWLNLLIDTKLPICGNAAQRMHGMISNDGPKNIVDSVEYITSHVWSDDAGCNRAGVVLIAEQRVFAAREVMKVDARPGGYAATGGTGGVLGASGHAGPPVLHFVPTAKHTYRSDVNVTRLPDRVNCIKGVVTIKGPGGEILETAIPRVAFLKEGAYADDEYAVDFDRETDLIALIDSMLGSERLTGIVVEGLAPYGTMTSTARHALAVRAAYSGIPVVVVGRGNVEGFARAEAPFIGGSNLTATKARILLMAALMKLGSLPPAADADDPTHDEQASTRQALARYQEIFDTH